MAQRRLLRRSDRLGVRVTVDFGRDLRHRFGDVVGSGPPFRTAAMKRRAASLAALILVAAPAAAAPQLSSRPDATAATLAPGETTLANGAVAYRPTTLPPGPAPLVILLHGAGGYPLDFLEQMKPVADQRGLML